MACMRWCVHTGRGPYASLRYRALRVEMRVVCMLSRRGVVPAAGHPLGSSAGTGSRLSACAGVRLFALEGGKKGIGAGGQGLLVL